MGILSEEAKGIPSEMWRRDRGQGDTPTKKHPRHLGKVTRAYFSYPRLGLSRTPQRLLDELRMAS